MQVPALFINFFGTSLAISLIQGLSLYNLPFSILSLLIFSLLCLLLDLLDCCLQHPEDASDYNKSTQTLLIPTPSLFDPWSASVLLGSHFTFHAERDVIILSFILLNCSLHGSQNCQINRHAALNFKHHVTPALMLPKLPYNLIWCYCGNLYVR